MAIPQITFYGLDAAQVDRRWVESGNGLEAYVFDGADLREPDFWPRFEAVLREVRSLDPAKLTLHFPTDGADFVADRAVYEDALRFCRIAADVGAAGVTIHSNQFVLAADWLGHDLAAARRRTVATLAELNEAARDLGVWLAVENMPLVGGTGLDFDSVFVFPADFAALAELPHPPGVTWDVCHWALSHDLETAMRLVHRQQAGLAFGDWPAGIRHFHFSSYAGFALPGGRGRCTEGVCPDEGDADAGALAAAARRISTDWPADTGVVFEVLEDDYTDRRRCWAMLDWWRAATAT